MALNDTYFDAGALERARGAQRSGGGWPEYNGGILMPRRVHLGRPQYLYRFASSTTPAAYRARGCWWMEYEVVARIARYSREQGASPRDAARYFLALPWSWTAVDRLLRAELVGALDAYRGLGKAATGAHTRDAGTRYIPPQHVPELYQLFIPGLDVDPGLSQKAFSHVSDSEIWSAPPFA